MLFEGHANCLEFVKQFNLPLLVLGGGMQKCNRFINKNLIGIRGVYDSKCGSVLDLRNFHPARHPNFRWYDLNTNRIQRNLTTLPKSFPITIIWNILGPIIVCILLLRIWRTRTRKNILRNCGKRLLSKKSRGLDLRSSLLLSVLKEQRY